MADFEEKNTELDEQNDNGKDGVEKQEKKTPTLEELSLQLSQANATIAKYKNSIDKLTHNNAELNRWKKARMTAEEEQSEAEAEAKQRQEAYVKELENYKSVNEASKRYIQMGMSVDLAFETAKAEVGGDMESVLKNIQTAQDAKIEAEKAKWLKSRPDVAQGSKKSEDDMIKDAFLNAFK
jgi:hypothetical protein